jgi:hypothetical protein
VLADQRLAPFCHRNQAITRAGLAMDDEVVRRRSELCRELRVRLAGSLELLLAVRCGALRRGRRRCAAGQLPRDERAEKKRNAQRFEHEEPTTLHDLESLRGGWGSHLDLYLLIAEATR